MDVFNKNMGLKELESLHVNKSSTMIRSLQFMRLFLEMDDYEELEK